MFSLSTWLDLDGQTALHQRRDYAIKRIVYDDRGRRVAEHWLDAAGQPHDGARGHASRQLLYDASGQLVDERLSSAQKP